jgi:thiol-disulfide isomerase/thioredoxin
MTRNMENLVAGAAGMCVAGACLLGLSKSKTERTIEVFVADWCPHCRKIKGELLKLINDSNGYTVKVYTEGTPEAKTMEEKRDVKSFPTIIFTHGGKIHTYTGPRFFESIRDAALALA